MPLWIPPTVAKEPHLTLSGWSMFLVLLPGIGTPTAHVAGYNDVIGEGRVSSPIVSLDASSRCCVTASGRVYRLAGQPGLGSDASYVWARWLRIWDATVQEDLSQATLADFAAAAPAPAHGD